MMPVCQKKNRTRNEMKMIIQKIYRIDPLPSETRASQWKKTKHLLLLGVAAFVVLVLVLFFFFVVLFVVIDFLDLHMILGMTHAI